MKPAAIAELIRRATDPCSIRHEVERYFAEQKKHRIEGFKKALRALDERNGHINVPTPSPASLEHRAYMRGKVRHAAKVLLLTTDLEVVTCHADTQRYFYGPPGNRYELRTIADWQVFAQDGCVEDFDAENIQRLTAEIDALDAQYKAEQRAENYRNSVLRAAEAGDSSAFVTAVHRGWVVPFR